MKTFKGRDGFAFLDEREGRLSRRWFHYSPPETFAFMFRSPDWLLWQQGRYADAVEAMRLIRDQRDRESSRAQQWADNKVQVTRLQVVDAESVQALSSPLNYLLTYLTVTHPEEDRQVVDGDRCAAEGIELPGEDFLLHDDDLVMTKYEGEPGVIWRDLYLNRAPEPGEADDQPAYRRYADLAENLLTRRDDLRYTGHLPGLDLLHLLPEATPHAPAPTPAPAAGSGSGSARSNGAGGTS